MSVQGDDAQNAGLISKKLRPPRSALPGGKGSSVGSGATLQPNYALDSRSAITRHTEFRNRLE